MVDRRRLIEELTDKFVVYQYRLEHPFPMDSESDQVTASMRPSETTRAIKCYYTDPLFRSKVDNLVHGVVNIVYKHVTNDE